jgi:voltage-gated potassium channel
MSVGSATRDESDLRRLRERVGIAFVALAIVYAVGVVGYKIVGGPAHNWLDALYMTTITLTTTGYGEVIPIAERPAAQAFTIILLLFGATGVVYFASVITAFLVEGDITEGFRRRRMQRIVESLRDHHIVCGAGQAGLAVLQELMETKRTAVLIESDPANIERLSELYPALLVVRGDFTDDTALLAAGVARAAGVVFCADSDKDSLVGTVTARQLNPRVRIVARATDEKAIQRLKSAGADAVVSPGLIGGMRLASELVRPAVVGFLDRMLRDKEQALRIEEVDVPPGSPLEGRTIGELAVRRYANLLVLAIQDAEGHDYAYNPDPEHRVAAGARLIVMGNPDGVSNLQAAFTPPMGGAVVSG